MLQPIKHPGGFKGQNFMTPQILGYYKLAVGYAELSTGTGFHGDTIYGVTVRPETPDDRRSQVFYSRREALDYIESLSEGTEND